MEVAQIYLGNINDRPELSELFKQENYLEVYLQPSDRHKGRIHTHTQTGVGIGIIKTRDHPLQSGDVFKTESGIFLLIHLQTEELLVLDFSALEPNIIPTTLVYLGYVLGNQHYPIAIQNNKIYVQLVTEPKVIENIIKNLHIPGLQITYENIAINQEITFYSHHH
ncbi:MAG: urease accessory protein UreE [Waterburya sp.]